MGWGVVFFFKIGGEWAYVQRFVCVPTAKDAVKSTYLFGVLYIVSPLIWMLPPMAYRWIDPNVDYEQAYVLASQAVLPSGMLGLMIAAMCSATASMATTQLNVFAGAFTTEIYQRIFHPDAQDAELVRAGRIFTFLLGVLIIAGALIIPRMGTYTGYILASVAILTGPLVLPTIWGLYSRKIGLKTAWIVTIFSIVVGLVVKLGFQTDGWLAELQSLSYLTTMVQANERVTEIVVGTVVPLLLLFVAELGIGRKNKGWEKVQAKKQQAFEVADTAPSILPAKICAWSTIIVGVMIALISIVSTEKQMTTGGFAGFLILLGVAILTGIRKKREHALN